ncbi:uncharacterized protein N7473_010215 [Penicillium subrubescens]|uniref:uncharacterized protein n=1 Tax=Penicillium subrubescens TaxID=1316194 RepID=UPI00254590DC|nr:uncharacterized protein N7473_010215 [Penicillium subrubescens]KAJ5883329.1 hypothetical protein N7473_010215 [Penicillium subrubescens]
MRSLLILAGYITASLFVSALAVPTDPLGLETRNDLAKRSLPRLVNFDNNNADDRKKSLKIRQSFRDSLELMDYAIKSLDDTVFSHYFDKGDKSKVQDVFKKALGGNPSRGADELGDMYITNIDVNSQCGDASLLGYTGKDGKGNQIIHFCDRLYNKPLIKDVKCGDLEDTVGANMAVMGATLLHEFMHADTIGKAALGQSIIDVKNGYGPLETRSLKASDALKNADSYTWMATENLWTVICEKKFSGPRDARDTADPDCGDKTCTVQ